MQSVSNSLSTLKLSSAYDNTDDVVNFILEGLRCSMNCFENATRGTKLENIWGLHEPGIQENVKVLKGCLKLSGTLKEMYFLFNIVISR